MDLYNKLYTFCADENHDRRFNYTRIIANMLTGMFEFLPELPFSKSELLNIIMFNGICGIQKTENGFVLTAGNYVGVPEPNEQFPPRYIGVRPNYSIETNVNADDFVIAYMYPDRLPDTNIYWFAEQFSETDKSLYNNLIFSRIAPIAVVGRENERQAYINCVNTMLDGDLVNCITSPINPIDGTPDDIIKTIDITDGKYSEKIQYLSRYHEDLTRRLAMLYGHSMATTSKHANLLTDEVHSTETFSKIYPEIMLNCIRQWLDEFNRKFNTNITVDFGTAWKHLNNIGGINDEQKTTADDL